jgi:DNA-binding CsgD family transcriptional regulator
MIAGLRKQIDARHGGCIEVDDFTPTGQMRLLEFTEEGQSSPTAAAGCRLWAQSVEEKGLRADLLISRFSGISRAVFTRTREEVVDDDEWAHRSESSKEVGRLLDVDPCLMTAQRLNERGLTRTTIFHRNVGERPFGLREKRLLHLFSIELHRAEQAGLMTAPTGLPHDLSPRQRQVLELLLAGDSVKQLAAKLGISQHTAADHLKGLYKRQNVHSRAELMAQFVDRR